MPKYKIAEFITDIVPHYNVLKALLEPFEYCGDEPAQIILNVTKSSIIELNKKMAEGTSLAQTEEFACATAFNRAIIKNNAMLIHSSAIKFNDEAYLFAAESGTGKSTHTRLWQKVFGSEKVKIINDDKPVVRFFDDKCVVYGTPFDGGSNIANNDYANLKAVAFLKQGNSNSICKANTEEILENLYISTVHLVDKATANSMLSNFEKIMNCAEFYILTCNMDVSAARLAFKVMTKNNEHIG